jgi:hypothetical protein
VDSCEFGTAVNNEIEIIPACLPSAHALSMGWEWSVRAVASGVGDCCRGGMAVKIYNLLNTTPQSTQRTQSQGYNVFADFAPFAVKQ